MGMILFCIFDIEWFICSMDSMLFKVTAFKDVAEDFATRTIIGSSVLIKGRLQSNNYEKDDKVYYSPELLADKIYYVVK